jgi:hypothetical protein
MAEVAVIERNPYIREHPMHEYGGEKVTPPVAKMRFDAVV